MIYEIIRVRARTYNPGSVLKNEDDLIALFEHDEKGIVLIDGELVSPSFLALEPQAYFEWIKERFDLVHGNIAGIPEVDYIDASTSLVCKSDVMHLIFDPIYSSGMGYDFVMDSWSDEEAYGYDADELRSIAKLEPKRKDWENPSLDLAEFLVLYRIYVPPKRQDDDFDPEPHFAGAINLSMIARRYEEFKDLNKAFGGFGDTLSDAVAKANGKE